MLQQDIKKNKILLDYLQVELDCPYLSNLYFTTPFCEIARVLDGVIPEAYPVSDWEHVAQYLFRKEISYTSQSEAKEAIVRFGNKLTLPPSQLQQ